MVKSSNVNVEDNGREFTNKHIQATKTLFNIAHCLGGILDVTSWHIVLATLQKTELYLSKMKNLSNSAKTTQIAG